jgi:hypothetical protein
MLSPACFPKPLFSERAPVPNPSWILTDVDRGIWLPEFAVSPRDASRFPDAPKWFPHSQDWSIRKQTLRGGLSEGLDLIEVNNGRLAFSILPTRGMGLWQGAYGDLPIGWKSPVRRPVHPAFVNQTERGGLGWLSGFNEWMCRCGLDSNGAPGTDVIINNQGEPSESQLTLHGKIANTPAHYVEVQIVPGEAGTISVTGVMDETMLFGPCLQLKSTVTTTVGSNQLTLIDEVTNLKGTPSELELLYHTNLGPPFLERDARLSAPVLEVAPRDARAVEGLKDWNVYGAPTPGFVEQAYWMDLAADKHGETLVLLRNAHGEKGISLHFNKRQLPCFTLWKNTQAEADGYVTGLEPGTNYPNLKTFERRQGRVIMLPPGATYQTRIEIRLHRTPDEVAAVEEQIAVLQRPHQAKIHAQPHPKYSALK